ncbi:uncharacterized protein [Procambarus clarkii]|uniref:uncharacterized protein n=1 Tax=Procambarus clarkii TaxID=6728 RepID=UPI003742C872
MTSNIYIWMKIWVWAMLWACSTPASRAYVEENLTVGVNSEFCEHNDTTLFCDYKTTDKSVRMPEELGSSFQEVFVTNAEKLQLSEGVCVNVTIINVPDVDLVKSERDHCGPHLKFSARLSILDRLPSQFSHVELKHCSVTSLATSINITNLIVANSNVETLDLVSPLQQGVSVDLISTKIETLTKLHVKKGSNLQILKSSVDHIASRGLIIEGNVVLNESSTNTSLKDSVVMLPGATLTLNKHAGNLEVMATLPESCNQLQHNEPSTGYFIAFVVCLTLMFLVIIASVIYIFCSSKVYLVLQQKSKWCERQ